MKTTTLRCKRCKERFTAAPYHTAGGYPEYCPTCVHTVQHVQEIQRKCQRCGTLFTAVRRDVRTGLPSHCASCQQAMRLEQQKKHASTGISFTGAGAICTLPAKHPSGGRFSPKVERQCHVWWDKRGKLYRGMVLERARPTGYFLPWPDDSTVIHEAVATSIPDLVDQMGRYCDVDEKAQHQLYVDTPLRLRDQAGLVVEPPPPLTTHG